MEKLLLDNIYAAVHKPIVDEEDTGLKTLTSLFNVIHSTGRIPTP